MDNTDDEAENLPEDTETEAGTTDYESETESLGEEEESETQSVYDPDDFISGPKVSDEGTLGLDTLEFDFSYGYDCLKYFNLTVLDESTLVFSSGNYINFLDVNTKEITFRRSALGGGVGHIRKNNNPEYPYFAVAESGDRPIIILYVWPTFEIVCILRGGAEKVYTNMDFNPDGDLLVSQSGEPDFLITIWDWQRHTILLRTKSYVNDVYRVKFSPYVAGQLTTCGMAHIKFWKMASTFTGLKLKGELGRFGKTEYSDIVGVLPMPDAKVVSGCSWGNILVWDDGLITFEVFRSLRRKCHEAPIVQFYYVDGELWTVSMDGHVKVWWFEKIDQADPPDDDRVILVDPTYDFYTPGVKLMSIEKRKHADASDTFWYAQDGNGGIWLIDLNTEEEPKPSQQLFTCHGGKVVGLAACPFGPYIATLGELGTFYLYNYVKKRRVLEHQFPASGTCLIWLPLKVDQSGALLLAGFGDGQVRVCCLQIREPFEAETTNLTLSVPQVIKPHNKPITVMSVNPEGTLLVTAGEDSTIFVFRIAIDNHKDLLVPIGFHHTTDVVTAMTWHEETVILLGCMRGHMMQIQLPSDEQPYTEVSFLLELETVLNQFRSYKSQIKRDEKVREIEAKKAKKVAKKRDEMEQIKKDNPGLEIDEETFLVDSESEEELEPLFFPEIPNRIIWLKYTSKDTIWLSMAGFDAGFIYEYRIDQKDGVPVNFRLIDGAEEMEISTYVYTYNKKFFVFAMQDGSIRVNRINGDDYTDLSDYFTISMHDNQNGFVPALCFSHDERYFFSCGHDGNIFSYKFRPPEDYEFPRADLRIFVPEHFCTSVTDVETDKKLSLEEVKMKAEDDRIQKLANEHKAKIREILKNLKERYKKLLAKNLKLLPSQIIPREDLEPDTRVAEYVDKIFEDKIDIVRRQMAYDVEKSRIQVTKLQNYFTSPCDRHTNLVNGINDPDCAIRTVRQRVMADRFYDMLIILDDKLKEEEGKGRPPERFHAATRPAMSKKEQADTSLEFFLLNLSPSMIEFRLGTKLSRLLEKYRKRRAKWDIRAREWEDFLSKKPIAGRNHPDDEKFLAEAKISFGDYKLKENPNYKTTLENRETTVKHYKKLLDTRGKQYNVRHNFIQLVYDIRDAKYELIEKLKEKQQKIDVINEELPEEFRKNGPPIPKFDEDEYPEEKLQVRVVLPESEPDDEVVEFIKKEESFFVITPSGNDLQRMLLAKKAYPRYKDGFFHSDISNEEVLKVAQMSFEELCNYPEDKATPYESSLRAIRMNRILYHQKLIMAEMQEMIDNFNNWIFEARKQRLPILIRGNFIDIFIVGLNEELQILKNCEEQEDKLSQIVNTKLGAVHDMEDTVDLLKNEKYNQEVKLENLKIEQNLVIEQFKMATENTKFYDFLKKVFKKKFKPPKIKADDDTSSSESSSSEDDDYDDDEGSIDSKDFGFIKQDLNVCPKGCDPTLFSLIVNMRSKRHEIEQADREELRLLDFTKKEIDINTRKLGLLRRANDEAQDTLEAFRREKQKNLNNVRCTVILNLDQIYGFDKPEEMKISDFLVFSRSKLSDLYKRVVKLQNDALEEQGKHDTYLKHLLRMKKDIVYMNGKAKMLKQSLVDVLSQKFGKIVDINELEVAVLQKSIQKNYVNELEEVVLKKLVYDLRIKTADVRTLYVKELDKWQKVIDKAQNALVRVIKGNTKRLELLAVISKEKKDLVRFIDGQDKKQERVQHMEDIHEDFVKDLQKLQSIIDDQNETIQDLKEEIKLLKTKGMAQEVTKRKERRAEYEKMSSEERESEPIKWTDYEQLASEASDEKFQEEKGPIIKDITIPGYYSVESEDIIAQLLDDLLKDVDENLKTKSKQAMVTSILSSIFKCVSVRDIVKEIIDNLPMEEGELTGKQLSSIEAVAERLMDIQEPEVEESLMSLMRDILEETVSEVLCQDPHYLIPTILEKLLDNLPLEVISSDSALDEIALIVKQSSKGLELDKEELCKSLDRLPSAERQEIVEVVKEILERVYGTAVDFLYIINKT